LRGDQRIGANVKSIDLALECLDAENDVFCFADFEPGDFDADLGRRRSSGIPLPANFGASWAPLRKSSAFRRSALCEALGRILARVRNELAPSWRPSAMFSGRSAIN
jgi:hypothetical protein